MKVIPENRRVNWFKAGLAVLLLALLWTTVAGWLLPRWGRAQLEQAASQALGLPVTVGQLSLQPWTLRATLKDVRVGSPEQPLLTVSSAQARVSLESLFRLAPVVRSVRILGPEVWVERLDQDRFNFTPVLERLSPATDAPAAKPARYAIYNIELRDGKVHYTDHVLGQKHAVEGVNIGVPFISNLPGFVDVTVQPLLEARVNGSALGVSGRALPFKGGTRSMVALNWQKVDLAYWVGALKPLLPPSVPLTVQAGELAAALELSFEQAPAPAKPLLGVRGTVQLRDVDARWAGAQVRARWSELSVQGLDLQPLQHQARVAEVALSGLRIDADLSTAVAPGPLVDEEARPAAQETDKPAWAWSVGQLRVLAPAMSVKGPAGLMLPELRGGDLKLSGLDSAGQAAPAMLRLSVADALGAQWLLEGQVSPGAQQASLELEGQAVPLAPWLAALGDVLSLPVKVSDGVVQLKARLEADQQGLNVSRGQLALRQLRVGSGRAGLPDQLRLEALEVEGAQARMHWPAHLQQVQVASVVLDGLDAQLTRDARGQFPLAGPEGPTRASSRVSNRAPPAHTRPRAKTLPTGDAALSWRVDQIRCRACALRVDDMSVTPTARLALQKTALTVEGVSHDMKARVAFDVDGQGQGNGRIQLKGEVRPEPLDLRATVGLRALDLRVLQSYLAPHVNVVLQAAKAHAQGHLNLSSDAGHGLGARYRGRFMLGEVRTHDSVTRADLLRWRALALEGADLAWKHGQLDADLGTVSLRDFYGRVIVNPDGRLNLAQILKEEAGQADRSLTTPQVADAASAPLATATARGTLPPLAMGSGVAAASPASTPHATPAMRMRWKGIALQKGRLDFTDTFVQPNYSARLTQIDGSISALSTEQDEAATVSLLGSVDDGAPLSISGQVHPLAPRLFLDLKGTAKGIELTRLTPYAARYAGYAIEKGSLSVDVSYQVADGKLKASNQIFLDQLTFGEKVDSKEATKLPVLLAVSLLKNRQGVIDVALPISGSLDDPEFSVGGIIWQVFVNLITKAVTAPFALLSGGDGNELGFVPFEPGSDELNLEARQRLDALAEKLADRPALKLEATGWADAAVDLDGMRQRHVDRLIRQAKRAAQGEPVEGAGAGPVVVAAQERAHWLAAAYKAADIKKPRNLVGMVKALPDDQMEALLKASAKVSEADLPGLADRRADRVKAYFAQTLPAERVLLTASKLGSGQKADGQATVPSRVQFTVK